MLKSYITLFFFFGFLIIPTYLSAKEITVNAAFTSIPIGQYLERQEDSTKTLTISDFIGQPSENFQANNHDKLILAPRRNSNIWYRAILKNTTHETQSLVFWTEDTFIRYMDFYVVENKQIINHFKGGLQQSFHQRKIWHINSAYPITLAPNSSSTIYLKVDQKWDAAIVPVYLATARQFYAKSFFDYSFLGLYHGIILMVILIGLVLFLATRRQLFFWFFIYALSFFLFTFSTSGLDYQYFIPSFPVLAHHNKLFFSGIYLLSFYFLMVSYFQEENAGKINFRQWHLPLMISLIILALLLGIFQNWLITNDIEGATILKFLHSIPLSLISLIILFLLLKTVIKNPKWTSLVFLVAFLGKIFFGIIFIFVNNGKIHLPFEEQYVFPLFSFFEIACLTALIIYKIFTLNREKLILDREVQVARLEKDRMKKLKELDEAKTRLYTNITHEFRTPLTVIKGLTDQIEGNADKKDIIQRNSNTLLRLINQLLDLSKADKGELRFQPVQNDVIQYIRYLSESFRSWGAAKNIRLHILPEIKTLTMDYDPHKLQDVLSNLLSNAIKNTETGGDIYIMLKKEHNQLIINVKDTGKGIESNHLPYIFDRFYQVDNSDVNEDAGSGIGLALSKELVQLMQGEISVKSEVGVGTNFEIQLPISQNAPKQASNEIAPEVRVIPNNLNTTIAPISLSKKQQKELRKEEKQATILVVEDNKDVQHYLSLCLEKDHHLLLAENGKLGIQQALEHIPDLILSDVMMPNTNGLELCEALKTNVLTSHIPIILLTAKADQTAKIQGLSRGADAYLTKPFQKEELLVRIQSLIAQRGRMQAHFLKNTNTAKAAKYATENQFLNQVKKAVLAHLSDATFDVQRLAFELKMSRSQVYRKVKALTGRSIAAYIRYLRLQEGKKLLETTHLNISEVAYEVGFNDLSYFSNTFSQEFGYPPNATRK